MRSVASPSQTKGEALLRIGQKLSLGFGGLLALLIAVSAIGIVRLNTYSRTLDRIFRENYDSVTFSQRMRDALDRLGNGAREAVNSPTSAPATQDAAVAAAVTTFQENLDRERANITLPLEGETVAAIESAWKGYQSSLTSLLGGRDAATRDVFRQRELVPASREIHARLQQIIDANLDNAVSVDGQVKATAREARQTLYIFTVAGVLLAVVFVFFMSRAILTPLRTLTRSAHEIENGNLDLVVESRSRDEIGQLAEAFNAMAAKLREFRRSDRAKLVRTQQTTLLAVRSLPDAVALVSADGTVELANDTAQRLFTLDVGSTSTSWRDPRLAEMYRRARDGGRPVGPGGYETAVQVFDERGVERFFLPQAIPILDGDTLIGVTIVLADVSNLRRLDEMKSGMLSVVSHELKTPLTSIRMAAHLLLDERIGSLNPKQTELLVAARDDSDRLNAIIENLLDMARIESGRAPPELRATSVRTLVDNAVEDLAATYRDKGVALETSVPDDLPSVGADVDRIGHVFSNLLNNALRFTPSGGAVRITAERDTLRGAVRITVSDTG